MTIKLKLPDLTEMRPRIVVIGVGGAGGNAINNMIQSGIEGVEFIAANTDAQALAMSAAGNRIQMGSGITEGLGAGSKPEIGAAAAEEALDEIRANIEGAHMIFITAGMGGGTGTGAAPVIARAAKELGILTVAVVSKPFEFEGQRRMRVAEQGVAELAKYVDTMIVIPNQNLFRVANEKTTFREAFQRADDILKSGIACITDLMVKEGLINLDFADVRVVMQNMGTALMGTGEAEGEKRALKAANAAISNPLLGEISMRGAKGLLVSITGSNDMTLYEVEEAASRVRSEVDPDSNPDINIIVGASLDTEMKNRIRVSVVATGIEHQFPASAQTTPPRRDGLAERLNASAAQPREATRGGPLPGQAQPDQTGDPRRPQQAGLGPVPGRGRPPERALSPHFEPAPPAIPIKPPRRPLTSEDFPELGGQSGSGLTANQRHQEPDHGRRGGLIDWFTGRSRSQDNGETGSYVASVPREKKSGGSVDGRQVIIERPGEARPPARRGESGTLPPQRAEPPLGERKPNSYQDEPIDIPGIFKRSS